MAKQVIGTLGKILYVHFEPDEDLLQGIISTVAECGMQTGMVLSITGSLSKARLSFFPHPGPLDSTGVRTYDIPGPLEASGQGIIGSREEESPYVHVHISVNNGTESIMGHLERGTIVRSLMPTSHFTIVLASVHGISLRVLEDRELSRQQRERFPAGAIYHELSPS